MGRTNCTWIVRDEVFEGYVRHALRSEDWDAFEAHFFACEACFDKLQTVMALQAELSALPTEALATQPASAQAWSRVLVPVAAGLVVIAALGIWLTNRTPGAPESRVAVAPIGQSPAAPSLATPAAPPAAPPGPAVSQSAEQPAPATAIQGRAPGPAPVAALSVLARVEPPLFVPLTLRGPRDEAAEKFEAGMRRYEERDYPGAILALGSAADLNPDAAHVAFFLAICHLLTNNIEAAIDGLQKTVALGDSPYLEESHFYLAKARLRQGNVPAAREELERAIERKGRMQSDARRLLAQLDALGGGGTRLPAE